MTDRKPIDLPYSADEGDTMTGGVIVALVMAVVAVAVVAIAVGFYMMTGVR
jgi:hypothetical protein